MERQVAWAAGKPGSEDILLSFQSDTEAYYGRSAKARDFSRRAVDAAVRNNSKESAALWQVNAALREAEFGNIAAAKQGVATAMALAPGRDVKMFAALTLAQVGESARAKTIVEELGKSYPSHGRAQLMSHNGPAAAAEFQKFLDHRGIVINFPLGSLAHLGLARAYALSGNTAKAKTAYRDFFTLWKDADPDIPILKQAKAEYAKLQ